MKPADVLLSLARLADALDIDLGCAALEKLAQAGEEYRLGDNADRYRMINIDQML